MNARTFDDDMTEACEIADLELQRSREYRTMKPSEQLLEELQPNPQASHAPVRGIEPPMWLAVLGVVVIFALASLVMLGLGVKS